MRVLIAFVGLLLLGSCGMKVPYTEKIKKDYDLTEEKMRKVQFYISETIVLERSESQNVVTTTGKSGELVGSEVATSERIIIPANRKCILEGIESDGTVQIRFEEGKNRYLRFQQRGNMNNGRFYLVAQWADGKGELDYGNAVYHAVRGSASSFLVVKLKNYNRNKHSERVVGGMKVK